MPIRERLVGAVGPGGPALGARPDGADGRLDAGPRHGVAAGRGGAADAAGARGAPAAVFEGVQAAVEQGGRHGDRGGRGQQVWRE